MSKLSAFLMEEVEMPLIEVVADMEDAGYSIDVSYFDRLRQELEPERTDSLDQLKAIAGEDFNPASPKQVAKLLYDDLSLPVPKTTESGEPATDKKTLAKIDHEVARLLLRHRRLNKVIGTYCNIPSETGDDGRLHVDFRQMGAQTGRFTSGSLIQTIPKQTEEFDFNIRRGFRAPAGKLIVAADFDQQELRILASVSEDANMLEAIKAGTDLHGLAAVKVFGLECEPDEVAEKHKAERTKVKGIQFGLIYGRGPWSLAKSLGITGDEAQQLQDEYFAQFPGVKAFFDEIHDRVLRDGYVDDIFGRRRYFPNARLNRPRKHYSRMTEAEKEVLGKINGAKRQAQNFVIQGPAATITKLAMLRCHRHIKENHPNIKMVLQVHDELHFEVPEDEVDHFAAELPKLMCDLDLQRFGLGVTMSVASQVGPSWGELQEYNGEQYESNETE